MATYAAHCTAAISLSAARYDWSPSLFRDWSPSLQFDIHQSGKSKESLEWDDTLKYLPPSVEVIAASKLTFTTWPTNFFLTLLL